MVAEKDFRPTSKHADTDVPNLYVVKLMQSLKSRSLVREQFTWNHYYYFLTNEGIEFLRGYLHLPAEIVPATLKKPAVSASDRAFGGGRGRFHGARKEGAGGDFRPSFEGVGAGRGRAPASTAAVVDAQ